MDNRKTFTKANKKEFINYLKTYLSVILTDETIKGVLHRIEITWELWDEHNKYKEPADNQNCVMFKAIQIYFDDTYKESNDKSNWMKQHITDEILMKWNKKINKIDYESPVWIAFKLCENELPFISETLARLLARFKQFAPHK
jgi:hypothetical protein